MGKVDKISISVSQRNIDVKVLIAMTNNKGGSRSPCHRPLAWEIFWLGTPFTFTLELIEERRMAIQHSHLSLKPIFGTRKGKAMRERESQRP